MNIGNYLTMECDYEEYAGEDKSTRSSIWKAPVKRKCFKYGKELFIRDGDSSYSVSAQAYLMSGEVVKKSKVDGLVLKGISAVPNFDGSIQFSEVYSYEG